MGLVEWQLNASPQFSGLKALNKELAYELLALAFTQTQMFGLGNQPVDVIYDQKSTLLPLPQLPTIPLRQRHHCHPPPFRRPLLLGAALSAASGGARRRRRHPHP